MTPDSYPYAYSDLPSVDKLLNHPSIISLVDVLGRTVVTDELRTLLDQMRQQIRQQQALEFDLKAADAPEQFALSLKKRLSKHLAVPMRSVFNLTGVVLHTNLGRALLPTEAIEAVVDAMRNPMNLEFDLATGQRGDRDDLVEELLCELTGAEAATIVNNNAAAVLLMLSTIAEGREVVVSRGELVEIGGSFRIPDIMKRANCHLVEVGTTNRTHLHDYEEAIGEETAMLMKVHTSNYQISGFTKELSIAEVAKLAHQHNLPATFDLGSGTLVDLADWGLPREITVRETIEAGADLVTFSGDKLLGAPQAGIIVGRADLIAKIKKNPLKRALRVGKITLAGLAAVLQLYRHPESLAERLTTLRLFTRSADDIKQLADSLQPLMQHWVGEDFSVTVESMEGQIGSGALPTQTLASYGFAIRYQGSGRPGGHILALEERLRTLEKPVIGRIAADTLWLDLRCLEAEQVTEFTHQLQSEVN